MKSILTNQFAGMGFAGGSIYVSFLPQVEIWLRVATLAAGLVLTILSCVAIVQKMRRKYMTDKDSTTK